jgi:hypothetical protein
MCITIYMCMSVCVYIISEALVNAQLMAPYSIRLMKDNWTTFILIIIFLSMRYQC